MNQLKAEILVDDVAAERKVEGFKRKVNDAARQLGDAGLGDEFAQDFAGAIEQVERRALSLQRSFNGLRGPRGVFDPLQQDASRAQARAFQLQRQLEQIQRSIARGGAQTFLDEMAADAVRVQEQLTKLEAQERRLQSFRLNQSRGGPGGGRGSGVAGDIGQGVAGGLGIPLGPGAIAAAGTAFFIAGVDKAIDKAREAAEANRLLTGSATDAGLAYNDAAQKAENFAKQTGLQRADAEATYASLIRVAQQSGQVQNLDKIQRNLADLAAQRGIAAKELTTLTQQILSGQDEALNRLGFKDPSKLAADYAQSVGKSVDQLTQQEQVLSRLIPLMEAGERAAGASEERLKSATGQLTLAEQGIGNLTTQIGKSITESMEYRNVLSGINNVLQSISLSSDEVKKKLAAGLTPEQIGEEQATSTGNSILTGLAGGFAAGKIREDKIKFYTEQARKAQQELEKQASDAEAAAARNEQKRVDDAARLAAATQAKETLAKLTLAASHEEQLVPQIDALKKLRAEYDNYSRSSVLAGDVTQDFRDKIKSLDEQIFQANRRVEEMVRTTFRDTRSFLEDMTQRVNRDNPFVSLFQQADSVMERSRERFLKYGETFVEQMAAVESKAINLELLALRIQQSQKVIDSQGEARRLQFGPVGVSAEDQRRLDVYGRRVDAARDIPSLLAQAQAVERGRLGPEGLMLDQGRILRQQIAGILKLRGEFTGETNFGDRAARSQLNEELISLFQGASPDLQRQLLQRGGYREQIAGAFRGQAGDRRQAIEDALRRAEAGRFAIQTAEEKLRDLQRFGGFDNSEVLKQYLAVTGGLSSEELTPELRRGRIAALNKQAEKDAKKEDEAAQLQKQLKTLLGRVENLITAKGFKIDQDGAGVLVDVRDSSDRATVSVLGEGFK